MSLDCLRIYQSDYPKIRIGSQQDGGYVMVDSLYYDCLISCGIANDITFEKEFCSKYPLIPCFAFDGTIDNLPEKHRSITFIRKNISYFNSDMTTNLFDLFDRYHQIFLKMDIESHEFRWLQTLSLQQLSKIKQIVIEFHFPFTDLFIQHFDAPLPVYQKMDVLKKISTTHTLVHVHANNCCGTNLYNGIMVPNVFECTYVRNDIQQPERLNKEPLPTPLDRPNVPIEDIYLVGYPFVDS